MPIHDVFATVFPVFAIILAGFVFARLKRVDLEGITEVIIYITTPCLVFSALMKWSIAGREIVIIPAAACAIVLGCGGAAWICLRLAGRRERDLYLPAMFMNSGNMLLPLALFAWGDEGLSRAVLFFVSVALLHSSLGIALVSRRKGPWEMLRLPWLYASLLAIALNMRGAEVPDFLGRPVDLLGQAAIPLMLLSLGIRLRSASLGSAATAALLSFIRIVGGAALAAAFVWTFGIEGVCAKVIILGGLMPSAVINFVLAEKYGEAPHTVASTIVMTTAASVVTIPIALKILG